jgi:catechol 2,3-dioxygenase-like lactoylglutathione lyase family enzyme
MPPKAGYSTPLLHVADIARSLRFYELLGFETIDTEGDPSCLGWARMHCEGGALMFLAAEEDHGARDSGHGPDRILFYLYTPDLPGLREHLVAQGVEVSPIKYPDYMRSGEVMLKDPDGYVVLVGHWGKPEHEAWERRLAEKKKA